MPSELRTIVFNQQEVVSALTEYRRLKGKPLRHGTVFKFSIEAQPTVRAALAVAVDGEDRLEHYEFLSEELGAALVMACMKARIPLPARGARKALQVLGDNLSLVVSMGASLAHLGNHIKTD